MRSQEIFRTTITTGTPAATNSGFVGTNYETRTVQATTQASSSTIVVYGSNDGVGKVTLGTLTLASAGASDGIVLNAPVNWKYIYVALTAQTGTGDVFVTTSSAEAYK